MKRVFNFPLLVVVVVFSLSSAFLHKNITVDDAAKVDHSIFNSLLKANVTSDGAVNYEGFKKNSNFKVYLNLLYTAKPNNSNWSKDEKLAFWINAYNAYTIKLINDNWPLKSIKDIENPWTGNLYPVGGEFVSLNDIEHKVLRKMQEPRVHFAIVCA